MPRRGFFTVSILGMLRFAQHDTQGSLFPCRAISSPTTDCDSLLRLPPIRKRISRRAAKSVSELEGVLKENRSRSWDSKLLDKGTSFPECHAERSEASR